MFCMKYTGVGQRMLPDIIAVISIKATQNGSVKTVLFYRMVLQTVVCEPSVNLDTGVLTTAIPFMNQPITVILLL